MSGNGVGAAVEADRAQIENNVLCEDGVLRIGPGVTTWTPRAVLMQQRRDQLKRGALTGWRDRWWTRLPGALLGYGYRPSRALARLVGVLALSVALAIGFGAHGGLAQTPDPSPPITAAADPAGPPCRALQLVGKGLDLGTPFLPTARSGAGSCEVTATAAGDALTIARWILQLAAWALAALFIAGFTGIVRRT